MDQSFICMNLLLVFGRLLNASFQNLYRNLWLERLYVEFLIEFFND